MNYWTRIGPSETMVFFHGRHCSCSSRVMMVSPTFHTCIFRTGHKIIGELLPITATIPSVDGRASTTCRCDVGGFASCPHHKQRKEEKGTIGRRIRVRSEETRFCLHNQPRYDLCYTFTWWFIIRQLGMERLF
jgi:hypothetical protein